jgi:hypothetical protein
LLKRLTTLGSLDVNEKPWDCLLPSLLTSVLCTPCNREPYVE